MAIDTTDPSYWLNWRFFICAIGIFTSIVFASILIWKFEGFNKSKQEKRENRKEVAAILYKDEAWNTCLKGINPIFLLVYRVTAFLVLLSILVANFIIDGGKIFFFYTQWTFTLVTFYFGLASMFSIYGCCPYRCHRYGVDKVRIVSDAERGIYAPMPMENGRAPDLSKRMDTCNEPRIRQIACIWGYVFQIIFQACAGAAMLTDIVFWLILVPFFTSKDFRLDFMLVSMHSINAVFVLGDAFLNSMRFPMFRMAYFVLWTATFVIFQWIVHTHVSMWWPYPFLDLSSPFAPLWYMTVGLMHIPSYGAVALMYKMKHSWLSKSFPQSYQGVR